VVKTFLTYVTRHGFTLFAWWRVIVGTFGLMALAMDGSFSTRRNDGGIVPVRSITLPYAETVRSCGSAIDIAAQWLPANPA